MIEFGITRDQISEAQRLAGERMAKHRQLSVFKELKTGDLLRVDMSRHCCARPPHLITGSSRQAAT